MRYLILVVMFIAGCGGAGLTEDEQVSPTPAQAASDAPAPFSMTVVENVPN